MKDGPGKGQCLTSSGLSLCCGRLAGASADSAASLRRSTITSLLLHPPLPLVGVSIWMERRVLCKMTELSAVPPIEMERGLCCEMAEL